MSLDTSMPRPSIPHQIVAEPACRRREPGAAPPITVSDSDVGETDPVSRARPKTAIGSCYSPVGTDLRIRGSGSWGAARQ